MALSKLMLIASIAACVQFGWALQFSLLTPYTQFLGLSHDMVSFVWLCGPISGLLVQPVVGHYSDKCTSPFGRRRPYILSGALLLSVGATLVGFATDLGRKLGDPLQRDVLKHNAAFIFVLGLWLVDISNNIIQGPCRALLADISGESDALVTMGNSLFACFMAVGNILGFAAGSYGGLHLIFPFSRTEACDVNCANMKTCFLVSVILTLLIVSMVVVFIKEERLDPAVLVLNHLEDGKNVEEPTPSFIRQMVVAMRTTTRPMRILYLVTALNWLGFFPFLLYDTDWMGKEVYGGRPNGDVEQLSLYSEGVRVGALGLMLYVVIMGIFSLFMETMARVFGDARRLWSFGNFILAVCMALTVVIALMAGRAREAAALATGSSLIKPSVQVKASCFGLFALLGIPQAITYTIPFALASIYSKDSDSGIGQGLSLGLLNLAVVIPQMIVALGSGPLDSLFGGCNLPAFALGGIAAAIAAIVVFKLPPP